MMYFIYFIVILFSTILGAFVGLGGGVIIKPLLDLAGYQTVDVVNFFSSFAVFAMSISSTANHIKSKTKINFNIVFFIALGACAGGILGNNSFSLLLSKFDCDIVKGIQGIILGVLLVASVLYINLSKKSFKVKSKFSMALVGLLLGFTASFLGVGGGPINVAFLILFFTMSMKEAAVYSVAIIFFSQLTKLITLFASNHFAPYDLKLLFLVIPCAVIGGLVGAFLNKKGNEKIMKTVFTLVVGAVAVVNFYNAYCGLLHK